MTRVNLARERLPRACAWSDTRVEIDVRTESGWRLPIHYPPRMGRCLGSGSAPVPAKDEGR